MLQGKAGIKDHKSNAGGRVKSTKQGANRSKRTREYQIKEQTARKRLEKWKTRSEPLERN